MRDAERDWLTWGALLGFLGVAAGTFGTHALDRFVTEEQAHEWWATGVLYHLVHALALALTGLVQRASPYGGGRPARLAGWAFGGGILVFSGTLYAMALGAPRWLGAVTPLGGLGLLGGWLLLAATRPDQRNARTT